MRTVTANTSAEISKVVTKPFFVLSMDFATPLRYSSRGTVTIDGSTYYKNGFKIQNLKKGTGSGITGSLVVSNHDLVMGGLVLNQGVKNRGFTLHKVYGDGPWVAADMTLLIDGVMDAVPAIGKNVTITFAVGDLYTNYSPRLVFGPPVCNHCPPPGMTVEWNNDIKELSSPTEVRIPEN